ncbi:MAG: TetR/AcrR family transcriptional regulator [Acidimicrobiales bacterium]|nr:TetR/AcrR family transcriptional regulator [Acidimicrobiales bacterium]HRW37912.1 TetR/AcrR family transcriptional regulator [Aquihabitans sp.]
MGAGSSTEVDEPVDEPIDGRTARALRTKDAIVEACLGLIDEGDLRPTGPRIAERAGVSVRSIFQHFDDLDALFAAVGQRVVVRIGGIIAHIDPATPLHDRVDAFVHQRAAVLESLTPVLRAALVHAASSEVIRGQFEQGHEFLRLQVAQVFAPEVAAAPEGEVLLHGLVVALSWTTWDLLRAAQEQSVAQARAVVTLMVRSLLGSVADPW